MGEFGGDKGLIVRKDLHAGSDDALMNADEYEENEQRRQTDREQHMVGQRLVQTDLQSALPPHIKPLLPTSRIEGSIIQ